MKTLLIILGLILLGVVVIAGMGCGFAPGEKHCQVLSAITESLYK